MASMSENVYKCSTCLIGFPTKQQLTKHILTHDPVAKVKCQICGKILKTPKNLSVHMSILHSNRKRPSCHICNRMFSRPDSLRIHIDTFHSAIERTRFPCGFPGCEKNYLRKNALSRHIRADHSENPTRFRCTLCGKKFKTRQHLEKHISTHTTEKPYNCSTCGKHFATCTGMKSHEAIHLKKSARRIFQCEVCPHDFLSKSNLRNHVQVVHENQRNHPCPFCDKILSTLNIMRRHVDAMHPPNTEKLHTCDKCEYETHSKRNLYEHAKRHNPANGRECYFCKKQFFNFSNLAKHCRRHTLE